jgi:hypothetical protein
MCHALFRRFCTFFGTVFFFTFPAAAVTASFGMTGFHTLLGTLEPEKLDRQSLGRVMLLRDFRRLPPEVTGKMLDRFEQEFGRKEGKKPVFHFSSSEKTVLAHFQNRRNRRSENPSFCENNILLLAETKYFQWARQHQAAGPKQKEKMMEEVLADLDYWQNIYFEFLDAAGLPKPSAAELLVETQRMVLLFKADIPAEAELADSFAFAVVAAKAAAEIGGIKKTISRFFPFSVLPPPAPKPAEKEKSSGY